MGDASIPAVQSVFLKLIVKFVTGRDELLSVLTLHQ